MRLTKKLLTFLNSYVFDLDPGEYLALRVQCDGTDMSWQVQDGVLTTTPVGGSAAPLTIALADYNIAQLAQYIATQQGYKVLYVDQTAYSILSALVLLDGSGDVNETNGDHLYGYTNENWSYLEANANELSQAETQGQNAIAQMSTTTAQDMWLDVLGAYFGVPRLQGELDASYGPRIIAEVLRPRSNNIAMEMAITAYTTQNTTVTDVIEYGPTFPLYSGAITHNSEYHYSADPKPIYGLFDVTYGYDLLNGGDPTVFAQTVEGIISRYRAAGTQLRNLLLEGSSALTDALTPPTDGGPLEFDVFGYFADTLIQPTDPYFEIAAEIEPFSDTLTTPTDTASAAVTYNYRYNSIRQYNGVIYYLGGRVVDETY